MRRKRTHGREQKRVHRPRTITISLDRRGQTTQDFAVGIGVFLLSVAFVFSFLPSVVTPFDSSVGGAETAQADRIADQIVHNLSESGTQNLSPLDSPANEINGLKFSQTYAEKNLSAEVGLRASSNENVVYDQINVSVETFQGKAVDHDRLTGGDPYENQSAASSARIVTVDDTGLEINVDDDCEPACRLVVRVW